MASTLDQDYLDCSPVSDLGKVLLPPVTHGSMETVPEIHSSHSPKRALWQLTSRKPARPGLLLSAGRAPSSVRPRHPCSGFFSFG